MVMSWEMNMVIQVQNLDKAVCILHNVNVIVKGMHSPILLPVVGK